LQNEKKVLDVAVKEKFIRALALSGLKTIEVTSFVRADRISQMGDAEILYPKVADLTGAIALPCLVPNLIGLQKAKDLGVKEIAVFTATSDQFNKKNINASVDESLERIRLVMAEAKKASMRIRGYISTAFGCPYEGATSVPRLVAIARELLQLGCY